MLRNKQISETLKKADQQVYEIIEKQWQAAVSGLDQDQLHYGLGRPFREPQSSEEYHKEIFSVLEDEDNQVHQLITKEYQRRQNTLQLIAAENQCSKAVLAALGSIIQNKTAEGFAGERLHGGCTVIDDIEQLAIARAKEAFGAKYANVQPHSGTTANQILLTALLKSGERILSLGLQHGGHFSHGSQVSFTSRFFNVQNYYVDRETYFLDYDAIRKQAIKFKPKLIICGASAYSRTIDFARFREIADSVGAYLLADISHIAGLVSAGAHPSPIDYAHFTTTSTYKSGGPRGGLILMGEEYNQKVQMAATSLALWELIDKATFPSVQGTPHLNNIAAKAVFFKEMLSQEYKTRQFGIIANAKHLANTLVDLGHNVVTGGTENHMILVNVASFSEGLTGTIAQRALEDCGIIVDKIALPYDKNGPAVTSGIRLGTPILTKNGMRPKEMEYIAVLIDDILKHIKIISGTEYKIDECFRNGTVARVKGLCSKFPIC
jgi:glycine hydroxymethyltransferase